MASLRTVLVIAILSAPSLAACSDDTAATCGGPSTPADGSVPNDAAVADAPRADATSGDAAMPDGATSDASPDSGTADAQADGGIGDANAGDTGADATDAPTVSPLGDGGPPAFGPAGSQFTPHLALPGARVVLKGGNFVMPASVYFVSDGDASVTRYQATLVQVDEPSTLTVLVPSMPPGLAHIVVDTPHGESSSSDAFKILAADAPPELSGSEFSPSAGRAQTSVVITGAHFDVSGLVVFFGSAPAEIVGYTDSQITAVVPTAASGTVAISVVDNAGSVTSTSLFTVTP